MQQDFQDEFKTYKIPTVGPQFYWTIGGAFLFFNIVTVDVVFKYPEVLQLDFERFSSAPPKLILAFMLAEVVNLFLIFGIIAVLLYKKKMYIEVSSSDISAPVFLSPKIPYTSIKAVYHGYVDLSSRNANILRTKRILSIPNEVILIRHDLREGISDKGHYWRGKFSFEGAQECILADTIEADGAWLAGVIASRANTVVSPIPSSG